MASHNCAFCHAKIPKERVTFLKDSIHSNDEWTCVNCSRAKKMKGIYLGEYGTSELLRCNAVYNDSVSSVLDAPETSGNSDEASVETVKIAPL